MSKQTTTTNEKIPEFDECLSELSALMDRWGKRMALTSLTAISYYYNATLEEMKEKCPEKADEIYSKVSDNVEWLLGEDRKNEAMDEILKSEGITPNMLQTLGVEEVSRMLSDEGLRESQFSDMT